LTVSRCRSLAANAGGWSLPLLFEAFLPSSFALLCFYLLIALRQDGRWATAACHGERNEHNKNLALVRHHGLTTASSSSAEPFVTHRAGVDSTAMAARVAVWAVAVRKDSSGQMVLSADPALDCPALVQGPWVRAVAVRD
jgi:hypothetical protein